MKDYLLDVMQQHEHGLYMCELPTGNGKTYDSARAMKEYADSIGDDSKIIYLTTLNKNLPEDALEYEQYDEVQKKRKVKVFFSYAHADETYKNELNKHLSPLKRSEKIEAWNDEELLP